MKINSAQLGHLLQQPSVCTHGLLYGPEPELIQAFGKDWAYTWANAFQRALRIYADVHHPELQEILSPQNLLFGIPQSHQPLVILILQVSDGDMALVQSLWSQDTQKLSCITLSTILNTKSKLVAAANNHPSIPCAGIYENSIFWKRRWVYQYEQRCNVTLNEEMRSFLAHHLSDQTLWDALFEKIALYLPQTLEELKGLMLEPLQKMDHLIWEYLEHPSLFRVHLKQWVQHYPDEQMKWIRSLLSILLKLHQVSLHYAVSQDLEQAFGVLTPSPHFRVKDHMKRVLSKHTSEYFWRHIILVNQAEYALKTSGTPIYYSLS